MSNKAVEELTSKMGGLEISVRRRADSSSAEEAGESVPLAGRNAHCLKHPLRRRSSPWIYSAWSICKSSCQLSSQVGLLWPGLVVPFEQSWTGWAATSAPRTLA